MIAFLTGRLKRKSNDHLIVDVAGVGYQVLVPLSTFYAIPDVGEEVGLYIHTHLREESLALFGFLTEAEKELFLLLLGVSGIGPKLALSILSSLSVSDVSAAICASDDSRLCSIPGIGKKTAARMVLELKDKITLLPLMRAEHGQDVVRADDVEDATSALVNLGYKKTVAEDALKKIKQNNPGITIEELIREALSVLMKK